MNFNYRNDVVLKFPFFFDKLWINSKENRDFTHLKVSRLKKPTTFTRSGLFQGITHDKKQNASIMFKDKIMMLPKPSWKEKKNMTSDKNSLNWTNPFDFSPKGNLMTRAGSVFGFLKNKIKTSWSNNVKMCYNMVLFVCVTNTVPSLWLRHNEKVDWLKPSTEKVNNSSLWERQICRCFTIKATSLWMWGHRNYLFCISSDE